MPVQETISRNVRFFRLRIGLSLDELGELIGSDGPYIARIERSAPDIRASTIERLAVALGVSPGKLMSDETLDVTNTTMREFENILTRMQSLVVQMKKSR